MKAMWLSVATLLASTPAAAEPAALQYGFEKQLPLGLAIEAAPGVKVENKEVVGYIGTIKLKAHRELVILKSECESLEDDFHWSLNLHLGGELKPGRVAKQLLGEARSIVRR
jgi:hypothetical protein